MTTFCLNIQTNKLDRKGELRELYYIRIKILGSCLFLQLPLLICMPIGYKERERERERQTDKERLRDRQATHKREERQTERDKKRQRLRDRQAKQRERATVRQWTYTARDKNK